MTKLSKIKVVAIVVTFYSLFYIFAYIGIKIGVFILKKIFKL